MHHEHSLLDHGLCDCSDAIDLLDVPWLSTARPEVVLASKVTGRVGHLLNDRRFISEAVSAVGMPWHLAQQRILAEVGLSRGMDKVSLQQRIIELANGAWRRILHQQAHEIGRIVSDVVQQSQFDMKPLPTRHTPQDRKKLRMLAGGW